jgi:hypothetical protein
LSFPKPGYSVHIGDRWYVASSPDTGRVRYTEDHGTGTHEVPESRVPEHLRRPDLMRMREPTRLEVSIVKGVREMSSRALIEALQPGHPDGLRALIERQSSS